MDKLTYEYDGETFVVDREVAKKVVKTVDKGLVTGVGAPVPGQMCVEAAVCYAMGLPHGDEPICVNPTLRLLKIRLNDTEWSTEKVRAKALRKLAVLQLGTDKHFDMRMFARGIIFASASWLADTCLNDSKLAVRLREAEKPSQLDKALTKLASIIEEFNWDGKDTTEFDVSTLDEFVEMLQTAVKQYQRRAYRIACDYISDNAESCARHVIPVHANRAKYEKARDKAMMDLCERYAQVLIDMHVPAVEWLDVLDK